MARETKAGQVKWTYMAPKQAVKKDAGPKYSRFGESIRHVTPGALQCSMFCGGKQCKYENPGRIKQEEMAIKGLYSSWITDDILAMARPSSEIIKNYSLLEQFSDHGIKSIMNLQHPGEHASCGYGLEACGFSYDPEAFMQAEIFFYNFGWNDYGVRSLESILDMVKVMSFALQEGKAAVHCHAGLGRTGVLICCYFIYSSRLTAEEAIHLMRNNRPKAVQTRGQIECVKDFSKFLSHLWVIFPSRHHEAKRFTLLHYLTRQRLILHGMEARQLRNIPKIVCVVCSRLLELASVKSEDEDMTWKLPTDVKSVFAEPEEAEEPSTDCTDTWEGVGDNLSWKREDIETEIKHNPYVESDVGLRTRRNLLQRSQNTDDVIDDSGVPKVVPRMSTMGSGLLRAHSESDLLSPEALLPLDATMVNKGSFSPASHGVKLEPLNLCVIEKAKKRKNKNTDRRSSQVTDDVDSRPVSNSCDDDKVTKAEHCQGVEADARDQATAVEDRVLVAKALGSSACADAGVQNRTEKLKRKLNASDAGWEELRTEGDPWVLSRLLWTWLEELAEPVLDASDVDRLCEETADPIAAVKQLNKGTRDTLECLVTTACELFPLLSVELEDRVLRRLSMVLTHNRVLSLTFPRASLDRMASNSSGESGEESPGGGAEDDSPFTDMDTAEPVTSSPSYRMLVFLRDLMRTLKGAPPVEPS